ncbi:hypothetical protein [Gayadomonas joobiniege]|uniref:hypothetical protein n=1 Tax=Gayadomonas joobiniege TaxID=1234606 RepID=UPI0012DDB413|nr:hypothetical protein [Gayadomonas joobiniege]
MSEYKDTSIANFNSRIIKLESAPSVGDVFYLKEEEGSVKEWEITDVFHQFDVSKGTHEVEVIYNDIT